VEAWQEESTEEDSSLTRFARTVAHIESERVALRNHLKVHPTPRTAYHYVVVRFDVLTALPLFLIATRMSCT